MNKIILGIAITTLLITTSCTPDCTDDKSSYNSGYSAGHLVKATGSGHSCSSWASDMAKQGLSVDANSCYCAGFNDGKSGSENKYKND